MTSCLLYTPIPDPHDQPGTHWIAMFFLSPYESEFFDNYRFPPETYDMDGYIVREESGRFAYKLIRIQVYSHTSRSFRPHDLGRIAYIEVVSPTLKKKVLINTLTG